MTDLYSPVIAPLYESTAPVLAPARPERLGTSVFGPFVQLPPVKPRHSPRLQRLARRVQELTGWSARTVATALGTSHPTVRAMLSGHHTVATRTPQLPTRLAALTELLERLATLTDGDPVAIAMALRSVPVGQKVAAIDLLAAGDLGSAYVTALDVLNPPRRGGMMTGAWPARVGEAKVALDDERN